MKIPATLDESKASLSVKVRRSINDDIELYCKLLSEAHGHKASRNSVVEYMIGQFMSDDKDFQQRKKRLAKQAVQDSASTVRASSTPPQSGPMRKSEQQHVTGA